MRKLSLTFFTSREGRRQSQQGGCSQDVEKPKIPHRLSKSLSDLQNNEDVTLMQDTDIPAKPSKLSKANFFSDLKKKVYKTFHKSSFSRVSVRRRFSMSVKNLFEGKTFVPQEENLADKTENNNTDTEVHYESIPLPVEPEKPDEDKEPKELLQCSKRPPTSLAWEIFKLVKYGWYWGKLTPSEAERKLEDQPDGAFLVRDSSNDCHVLSLSFRSYGRTLHSRIEHNNGHFSLHGDVDIRFETVHELIFYFIERSNEGMFCFMRSRISSPSMPVRLIRPVSRFTNVQTLQLLCAYEIRQHVRMDNVQKLPLPERLKQFIYYPSL